MDHLRQEASRSFQESCSSRSNRCKKNSTLLQELESLIGSTASSFASPESFDRARRHYLSNLVGHGRHTISSLLRAQNRHQQDWTSDYRFYSEDKFDEEAAFRVARKEVEKHLDPQAPLVVAMDDSLLRKTGPHIHGVRYLRDPLSPPFHVNLVRGLRVLQISAALPQGGGMSRMIPIDFQHAVVPRKPNKKAPPEEVAAYKELLAKTNINVLGHNRLKALRQDMDDHQGFNRKLVSTVDGRFTNQRFLKNVPERTTVIGRIRKDTVLHYLPEEQPAQGRKRKYGERAPTPEEVLADDEKFPVKTVSAYATGKNHAFKIKTLGPVVMRMDGALHKVILMVIKPLGYRLKVGGRILYRQAGFLICTDPNMSEEEMLQDFLWRWDIEVNFRDEKTILGVGQAQVQTENSNQNAPALAVAGYSMLLLASVRAYGATGVPDRLDQAKWYQRQETDRATTNELINQLRREMWSTAIRNPHFSDFTSDPPPDKKSEKCPVPAESAIFLSLG